MLMQRVMTASVLILISFGAVFFSTPVQATPDSALHNLEQSITELIYNVSKSTVTVEASHSLTSGNMAMPPQDAIHQMISSGIIFDSVGHILVSASAIDGYDRINVRTGRRLVSARLIGTDFRAGLSLLETSEPVGKPVTPAGQYACAGQMVIAIGNSFGMHAAPSLGFCAGMRPDGAMQFSAPISSGTIGGGLFDLNGMLIGMITSSIGLQQPDKVGLAIPAYRLRSIVDYLLVHGNREAGYVGITTTDIEISPPLEVLFANRFASYGQQKNPIVEQGVMITDVLSDSPAERAGLMVGDLIFLLANRPITTAIDLLQWIDKIGPGRILEVGILRGHEPKMVQIRIGRKQYPGEAGHATKSRPISANDERDSLLAETRRLRQSIQDIENRLNRSRP